jgi:hypothetical protein
LSKYENYAYWARKTGGTKKLFLKYYHYWPTKKIE